MGIKLTKDQAAEQLGISRSGIDRLISSGALRAYRVGKKSTRIDIDDLNSVCKPIIPNGVA